MKKLALSSSPTRCGLTRTFALLLALMSISILGIATTQSALGQEEAPTVPPATRPRPASFQKVALIEFHRQIDINQTRYFKNRFAIAKDSGADLLIVEIDSPGGLKIESLEMARMLRDCKWAYTICLITDEAISGGALIALGCDEIHIAPNAKFGDIGEIAFDPTIGAFRPIEPKIESYLYRDARDIAESKGRPPSLAESMVDKEALVYIKPKEGQNEANEENFDKTAKTMNGDRYRFQIVRAEAVVKPAAPWKLVPETGPERFLTASGQRAFELGIANVLVENREETANALGVELKKADVYRHTATDTILHLFNLPLLTGLLIVVGLISLYVELSAPGIGIGGLLSGLCAALFFWSRFFGGTSGWLEVLLFVIGVIFILFEVFIIPGLGIPGATGLLLMLSSVILASQDFVFPETGAQWNQSISTILTLAGAGCLFIVSAIFISKRLGSIPIFSNLVLQRPESREADQAKNGKASKDGEKAIPSAHPEVSVGDWGTTDSALRPAGRVMFGHKSFDVVSDGSFVDPNTQVKVIKIQGNIITVAVVEEA